MFAEVQSIWLENVTSQRRRIHLQKELPKETKEKPTKENPEEEKPGDTGKGKPQANKVEAEGHPPMEENSGNRK